MAVPPKDLFSVEGSDPIRDWTALAKDLESFQPSLFKLWQKDYDCWRHHYQRFRDFEQATLFTAAEDGDSPKPSEQIMRLHRRALIALMQSGGLCSEQLLALPLDGEDAQERLVWERRLRTLVESLQESLELWHPVNLERSDERRTFLSGSM